MINEMYLMLYISIEYDYILTVLLLYHYITTNYSLLKIRVTTTPISYMLYSALWKSYKNRIE